MSLLDTGRESIVLIPEIEGTDSLDNPVRIPDPNERHWRRISVGRIQPASSVESSINGQRVFTVYTFRVRDFPAGAWARVKWAGREWDVEAEPAIQNGSDVTRHTVVTLTARTPAPVK